MLIIVKSSCLKSQDIWSVEQFIMLTFRSVLMPRFFTLTWWTTSTSARTRTRLRPSWKKSWTRRRSGSGCPWTSSRSCSNTKKDCQTNSCLVFSMSNFFLMSNCLYFINCVEKYNQINQCTFTGFYCCKLVLAWCVLEEIIIVKCEIHYDMFFELTN